MASIIHTVVIVAWLAVSIRAQNAPETLVCALGDPRCTMSSYAFHLGSLYYVAAASAGCAMVLGVFAAYRHVVAPKRDLLSAKQQVSLSPREKGSSVIVQSRTEQRREQSFSST